MIRPVALLAAGLLTSGLLGPGGAHAQREGASSLSPPRAPSGQLPVAGTSGSSPAPGPLGEVPPPPPPAGTGYGLPSGGGTYGPQLSPGFAMDANTATRLQVLDSDLQQLARGGNSTASGVITIATGGLSIALAFLATEDNFLRNYLVLYGSASVLTGVTELAVRPNASGPSIAYTHMPMGSAAEVQARLDFGETSLRQIARRARAARLITASIDVAVGLAVIPMFLGPNDFSVRDPFDYIVLLGSGISVVTGLINLLTRSAAEKYWAAYTELRDRLSAPRTTVSLDVVPLRQGMALTLSGTL